MTRKDEEPEELAPLTPDEDALVARMLAGAAGPEPMPAEVSERLSDLIDGLAAERSPVAADSDVVVLQAERRRRGPRLLLAAAAVLVVGYGVASVAQDGSLSGSDSGSADSAAAGSAESGQSGASQTDGLDKARLGPGPRANGMDSMAGLVPTVRLHADRLDDGVRRALRVLATYSATDRAMLGDAGARRCEAPELGRSERSLPARYDGSRAVLVIRPAGDGLVEATVLSCDGAELDATTVHR